VEDLLSPQEQYQDRLKRIKKAVALGKPDRFPVVLEYSGFPAYVTETPMEDFLRSPARILKTISQAQGLLRKPDAIHYDAFRPYGSATISLQKSGYRESTFRKTTRE
jgi:hypothetical protein